MRDPYSNTKTRFERTDRTGRFQRIEVEQEFRWFPVVQFLVYAAAAVVVATMWWQP